MTIESEPPQILPQEVLTASESDSHTAQDRKAHSMFMICLHKPEKENFATRVAKLDTGASVDVMSKAVFSALGIEMEGYHGKPLRPLGKSTIKPLGQVKVNWHVSQRTKTYTSKFVVLDDSLTEDFDVLLGDETIEKVGFYNRNHAVWILR